jgi:hypothetical protein
LFCTNWFVTCGFECAALTPQRMFSSQKASVKRLHGRLPALFRKAVDRASFVHRDFACLTCINDLKSHELIFVTLILKFVPKNFEVETKIKKMFLTSLLLTILSIIFVLTLVN